MSNQAELSHCSSHHNVKNLEIMGPCWERGKPCTLCDNEKLRALLQRFMGCRFPEGSGWKVASGANAGDSLSKVYLDAKKYLAGTQEAKS